MISLVVPSRGRPAALRQMIASAETTADDPDQVEVCVRADDDDDLAAYQQVYDLPTHWCIAKRGVMANAWNDGAAAAHGDILMMAADDLRFRTQGWDTAVRQAVEKVHDRIVLVYARDGHADERMATHPFVTRKWVDAVGRFTAPYFESDYVDLWLHDVATRIDRAVYLPDVLIEHMHPSFGKGEWDRTHEERMARAKGLSLPAIWAHCEPDREREARRLREAMAI